MKSWPQDTWLQQRNREVAQRETREFDQQARAIGLIRAAFLIVDEPNLKVALYKFLREVEAC